MDSIDPATIVAVLVASAFAIDKLIEMPIYSRRVPHKKTCPEKAEGDKKTAAKKVSKPKSQTDKADIEDTEIDIKIAKTIPAPEKYQWKCP